MAMDQAPGRHLMPPLSRWPVTPRDLWARLAASHEPMAPTRPQLWGADRDPGAIRAARENAKRAGIGTHIRWEHCELGSLKVPTEQPGLVIMNPPYGKRIGDPNTVQSLYKSLGRKLTAGFPGWRLAVVCPSRALAGRLAPGLREKTTFENGGLRVSFFTGTIPRGSDDSP